MHNDPPIELPAALRRRLGLPLLVLYGTGITVGAGIYVLIGAVAGYAGVYAPWSFVLAAAAMAFTVASYAELSTRFPVSAGEAAYVKAAFQSRPVSTADGSFDHRHRRGVLFGRRGWIRRLYPAVHRSAAGRHCGRGHCRARRGCVMGNSGVRSACERLYADRGRRIAGHHRRRRSRRLADLVRRSCSRCRWKRPPCQASRSPVFWRFLRSLDLRILANVVEEAKVPHRDIPRAMVLTLLISTVLYVAVAAIAVSAVPAHLLASSPAPLSLVFRQVAGVSPATISAIAIVATLNTILAQMTMAARVIYGMARQGDLPAIAGHVHPRTATPVFATVLIVVLVIVLALTISFERLAESTSLATLVVFALVNLALLRLRHRRVRSNGPHVSVPSGSPPRVWRRASP